LAAAPGRAFASAFVARPERSTPTALYSLTAAGTAHRITLIRNGTAYGPHVVSPDGKRVAIVATAGGGACYSIDSIGLLDLATATLTYPSLPDEPDTMVRTVRSVSWTPDGSPAAVVAALDCSGSGPHAPAGRLVTLGKANSDLEDQIFDMQYGSGLRAEIRGPVPIWKTDGTLVLVRDDSKRIHVANNAQDMSLRP
jgi:hypothetical protein